MSKRRVRRVMSRRGLQWASFGAASLLAVGGSIAGSGITESIRELGVWSLLEIVLGVLLLGGGAQCALTVFKGIQRTPFDFSKTPVPPDPARVLVLPLSRLGTDFRVERRTGVDGVEQVIIMWSGKEAGVGEWGPQEGEGLEELVEHAKDGSPTLNKMNWMQPLRSINHHKKCLEVVVLVGSADSHDGNNKGSHNQLKAFEDLVTNLYENKGESPPRFVYEDVGTAQVDFGSIQDVYTKVRDAVDRIVNPPKDSEWQDPPFGWSDIVIDATGGTKPVSMAAVLASLNSDIALQYIANDGETVAYNYNLSDQHLLLGG